MTERERAALFLRKTIHWMRLLGARRVSDLSRGELYVLQLLAERREAQPAEISASMEVSTARVTALLNGLERKGWVRRRPDPADRRKIRVAVTAAGEAVARRHRDAMLAYAERLLDGLGERDARELLRIMDRLIALSERERPPFLQDGE